MSDLHCRITRLAVHPIKSCGGIAVPSALLVDTGFDLDRAWMVVDAAGSMLTQRTVPRMALVQPTLKHSELVLRAPGMLALHIKLDTVERPTRVRVWRDEVAAFEMGSLAAQWFSRFLGGDLRLVRFDPDHERLSSRTWTGAIAARNAFSDGYPLLVAGSASLADLNARLAARGQAAVTMERFRPNIVLDGLEAFDEDHVDLIEIDTPDGTVRLKLVKPCVRCSVPNVDPATAEPSHEPGDTLAGFRADARVGGGITFGMDAVIVDGFDCTLAVGQAARAGYAF